MTLSFRYAAHSEVGLVRKNNQDSGYVSPTMLIVADGMGGAAAGDLASTVAARELLATDERLDALLAQPDESSGDTDAAAAVPGLEREQAHVIAVLAAAVRRANEQLASLVDDDPALEGMGTTVCGFVRHAEGLGMVNIGDSRAYLIRDGQLSRLTKDHSWVQTLVDQGRISEAEALEHPHRSLILKVLNGNPQHRPDFGWLDVQAGDRLLICSDGLCGLVTDERIAERVADADRDATIASLVTLAHGAGGHDNITIVVADIVEGEPEGYPQLLGAAEYTKVPSAAEHTATLPLVDDYAVEDADERLAEPALLTEADRYGLRSRRGLGGWLKLIAMVLLPLLVLAGAGFGWYTYTQTRYYVGDSDDVVAIYQGVPDQILGRDLSHVVETDGTRIGDLPPYYAQRVRQNIRVDNLEAARSTVTELREKAAKCVAQREERGRQTQPPTPPATPGGTASPSPTSTAPTVTTSPQVTTPEDC